MRRAIFALAAAGLLLPATPLAASAADSRRHSSSELTREGALGAGERQAYRAVFASIRAGDWTQAEARLAAMREGPLHHVARAELYLAPGSPRIERPALDALLRAAPELPHAERLARLAASRGSKPVPGYRRPGRLIGLAGQPIRDRARGAREGGAAAALDPLLQELIVGDRPREAEALLGEHETGLSRAAVTEFRQRIGWSYYLVRDDRSARRLSDLAARGGGEWGIHAAWVSGLASWRLGDCDDAARAFGHVAAHSGDAELVAAGNYWASRAEMKCGRPERVQARLRSAARLGETFYGLLAARALGIAAPAPAPTAYRASQWREIAREANVRAAIALVGIGERELAGVLIRHQARLGGRDQHKALIGLAADLGLASTQIWLAHNAPSGTSVDIAARYPAPDWRPAHGWRVDKSLVYAHALQESRFRESVVSPAGATGIMQLRPGTAADMARRNGESFHSAQLTDPETNIEYGQRYLEYLRDLSGTQGLLPKVIAAYNAGPAPISEWNSRGFDGGDPLLYIESIPYWETRGYVPIVLRNYWVYEDQAGRGSASREALVQGLWPRFPGLAGATALRMNAFGRTAD